MNAFESYLFGLILTDGSVYLTTRNRGKITIELQKSDNSLLYDIQKRIPESSVNTRKRDTNFKKDYESAIWSNHQMSFRNKFFSYGLPRENKRLIGDAPTVEYSEKDFWRGVFDGNGSIGFTSDNEPFISIVMTSENLKNTFCELLAKEFDIHKTVNPNKRDHIYNIILKNEDAITFCNFMYENADIYLNRKYEKYMQMKTWKRTKKKVNERAWTSEEIAFIISHSVKESSEKLHRTERSVKMKLWRLKQAK